MAQHIVVTEYNPLWADMFETEAVKIKNILGKNCIAVHHIGSTSVAGLAAKPVIDIMPIVCSLEDVDQSAPEFEKIGYEYMGEFGISGRRYLRKGGDERTHQIHIFSESSVLDIERHLAVRDYLRTHPAACERYARLKRELANRYPYDIEGYCDGKEKFVQRLEKEALEWRGKMIIRKAAMDDIDAIEKLYDEVHTAEENGEQITGWIRGVYPVRDTAETALKRDDLFVLTDDGNLCGAAIINKIQVDSYAQGRWEHDAEDDQVCVLHTLAISPNCRGKGYGSAFIKYYEDYALSNGCIELRIDTNARNIKARAVYQKHGYTEIGIIPTVFNGIPDIQLVLLEKYLGD